MHVDTTCLYFREYRLRSLKRVDNSEKIDLKKKSDLLVVRKELEAKHKENEILTEKIQEIEASHREVRCTCAAKHSQKWGTSHIGLVSISKLGVPCIMVGGASV